MKKFLDEFKAFALKGNMIDLAVGMIIGSAFTSIVNSLVNDIFMPLLSLITGKVDFTNMFIALDGNTYATLAEAKELSVATINYGSFITQTINFRFGKVEEALHFAVEAMSQQLQHDVGIGIFARMLADGGNACEIIFSP